MIEQKIKQIDQKSYLPMKNSKIFLSLSNFIDLQIKHVDLIKNYAETIQKK